MCQSAVPLWIKVPFHAFLPESAVSYFHDSCSYLSEVISYCGSDVEHLFMCLSDVLMSSLEKAYLVLSSFKTGLFVSFFPVIAAAAPAKSLQSCPTLHDPIDGSPPGSPVPGIL